jgi:hypothetical protein
MVFKEGFHIVVAVKTRPADVDALAARCREMAAKATNDHDRKHWVAMGLFWLTQKRAEKERAAAKSVASPLVAAP